MRVLGSTAIFVIAAACGDDSSTRDDAATAQEWTTAPALLGGGVQETAVVALDGKIYVIGGFDASVAIVASVRVYDTATSTWSSGADLPKPLHHANVTVAGDTIYVLGALEGAGFSPIGDVYAWNPKTDVTWTTKTSMPVGTQRGSAVVGAIGDHIYVAGGLRGETAATLATYSTTTDTWNLNLPSLPVPLDHGCGGIVAGKLYAMGGRYQGNMPRVFEYTPGSAWVEKSPMPTSRSGVACGIHGDQIIVAGGELNPANAESIFAEVEMYSVSTDSWTTLPPLPTPRHGMGGAVVDGVFYVPGGATMTGFAAVDTHEALRL